MSFSVLAAIDRLLNYYNDGAYDVTDNPGGFDNNGHRENFLSLGRDVGEVGSAIVLTSVAITGTTSLTTSAFGKLHVLSGTSANYTVTLPTPIDNEGAVIAVQIAKPAAASKLYTIASAAGNINDQSTLVMWAKETAVFRSDGTDWIIIEGRPIPFSGRLTRVTDQSFSSSTLTPIVYTAQDQDITGLGLCFDSVNGRFVSPRRSSWLFTSHAQLSQTGSPGFLFINIIAGSTFLGAQIFPAGSLTAGEASVTTQWSGAAGVNVYSKAYGDGTSPAVKGSNDPAVFTYQEFPQW